MRISPPTIRLAVLLVLVTPVFSAAFLSRSDAFVPARKVDNVLGPASCAECHAEETTLWRTTAHHLGSETLTRNPRSKEIAKAMGIRRIKTATQCVSCHFTSAIVGTKTKSVAGVSCESCHGSAKQWTDLHNDFGGEGKTSADETASDRAARYARCDAVGMVRPGRILDLAGQCNQCHTIADEELAATGLHPIASDFEFVAWSQGEVRHNFVRAGRDQNPASSSSRQRRMLVLGHAARLEAALRALASTNDAESALAKAMTAQAQSEWAALDEIQAAAPVPQIAALCAPLDLGESVSLAAAADSLHNAALAFEAAALEGELAALDSLLPAVGDYRSSAK